MTANGKPQHPPDLSHYHENRLKIPADRLAPYIGLHVAWSPDGCTILTSGEDVQSVLRHLKEAGIDPGQVVHDYIEAPDIVQL
jgi:hypothetical protein